METSPAIEKNIEEILSLDKASPRILRKDGSPLSVGEQKSLVLRSENYIIESTGLGLLKEILGGLSPAEARERFWEPIKRRIRHSLVPWFFISQRKLFQLLEWILDELEREPLDPRLIVMAAEALKVEHVRYPIQELEKIAELIGSLMTQSQLSEGERSLSASQRQESDMAPNYMQAMRAKRDVYKALGTLREVVRSAVYQRMEEMLSDI